MAGVLKLSRRARWAIPVGALVVTGAVLAGSLISVAQASPGLPSRTPAQLLAQAADSVTPPLTGTVVETISLGLPNLPGTANPTSIQFVTPAPADLTFTPPPGATVSHVNLTAPSGSDHTRGDVTTIGSGWLTVLDLPGTVLTAPSGSGSSTSPSGDSAAVLNALLSSATPVSGAWDSGRLLRTGLVSLLITDSGRTFVGAVQPGLLYAAAGQAATGSQATTP